MYQVHGTAYWDMCIAVNESLLIKDHCFVRLIHSDFTNHSEQTSTTALMLFHYNFKIP